MNQDPDLEIARISSPRYGVFTRGEAKAAGHSPWMIRHRLDSGRWLRLHPTVYAIAGTPASWHRDQLALCLWANGISAGMAAGFLFQLPGCEKAPLEILTTIKQRVMPRCGVIAHVTKRLPMEQTVVVEHIPCTSIERTVMDLCGQMTERQSAIVMDNALFRGLTTVGSLDHCLYLTARQGRNGCGVMRKLLRKRDDVKEVPNSPLETAIFEMFADSSLPMPELRHSIYDRSGNFVARPDFVYPEEKLVIEGHSKLWHSGTLAQELDREREKKLRRLGYLPVYLGWADVTVHKEHTLRMIEEWRFLIRSGRGVDRLS